ncbi:MAG: hypothetical protein JO314_04135 [Acidobacteria bacterium]|nr:hypothetical protein [Acidobacteriota bacterium]
MSDVTRRKFIGTAMAAGAIVASGGQALAQIASIATKGVGKDSLSKLGWDAFLPFVNTDFTFGEGTNAVVLRLVSINDSRPFGSKARSSGQENFVLTFTGPGRSPLKEGTYRVNHFNLGDFDLFIAPAGPRGRLNAYTAVINRVTVPE